MGLALSEELGPKLMFSAFSRHKKEAIWFAEARGAFGDHIDGIGGWAVGGFRFGGREKRRAERVLVSIGHDGFGT
jgi:hypothetical protein